MERKNVIPLFETIRHVAFRCGCVRSYKTDTAQAATCPEHGAPAMSLTDEVVSRKPAVA